MEIKQLKAENKQQINKCFLIVGIILIAIINYYIGVIKENFYIAIISIALIWIMNLCWGISNIKKRYIFVGMNIMMFVFILSRPIISTIRLENWWYFDIQAIWKSLNVIMISLISIFIGGIIADKITIKNDEIKSYNNIFVKNIMYIILVITFIVHMYVEINNYIYLKNMDYANMYLRRCRI